MLDCSAVPPHTGKIIKNGKFATWCTLNFAFSQLSGIALESWTIYFVLILMILLEELRAMMALCRHVIGT